MHITKFNSNKKKLIWLLFCFCCIFLLVFCFKFKFYVKNTADNSNRESNKKMLYKVLCYVLFFSFFHSFIWVVFFSLLFLYYQHTQLLVYFEYIRTLHAHVWSSWCHIYSGNRRRIWRWNYTRFWMSDRFRLRSKKH